MERLVKEKSKRKNYFREIRAKEVHSKMDQQENEQRQKTRQQNGPHQSGRAKKTCFRNVTNKFTFIRHTERHNRKQYALHIAKRAKFSFENSN